MRAFTIAFPLVPVTVGQVIDRAAWPAHITLIGNFRADESAAVKATAARFASTTPPVRVVVQNEAWFGSDHSVLVDLVEAPLLRNLHTRLLGELEAAVDRFQLLLPHSARDEYRPHRTATARHPVTFSRQRASTVPNSTRPADPGSP